MEDIDKPHYGGEKHRGQNSRVEYTAKAGTQNRRDTAITMNIVPERRKLRSAVTCQLWTFNSGFVLRSRVRILR